MITLEDVALKAGVSRATVSRVVNGDQKVKTQTKAKVQRAIIELGYSPNPAARALASNHSQTIGLVTTSYLGGFFGLLMDNVQTEADLNRKQLLVTQGKGTAENELNAINKLYNMRCDGLILHVRAIDDATLCQFAQQDKPFVLLDRFIPAIAERCIAFDHYLASQLAAQYLLDKGHQSIACIYGPKNRSSSLIRQQGFVDQLNRHKLTPTHCISGEYDLTSGYQAMHDILHTTQPITAIYCCNEEMALGALLAISEQGLRVPDDISLLCYDSGERAECVSPKLTSVYFPIREMAQQATRLLINPDLSPTIFTPQIIERESVKDLNL
ncbi:LacI family transcriptional regulator [Photobacterium damselae]|uniref:LacI family DNA-binding transcriptional regulator n=1 Tax=Photobacterium damselae TaxID=38293 RepID=UPI002340358C|nr:LacI family DNA-binding transcriptional regulator [Photobacterium damselae]MDC4169885.1 LacI family transcriptional regulator [Photobacterium damselae]